MNEGAELGADKIEATHLEAGIHLSYSLTKMVEFHSSACGAILSGDVALTWRGTAMVPPDREERFRVSRLVLGTKFNLLPLGGKAPDLWAALDFKFQGTDEDLADSGRPGVAFSFLVTQALGPLWMHLNVGWALSDGQENFPSVTNASTGMPESLGTDRIFFWGLSFVWPVADSVALSLQSVGNTNGFKDLSVLNSDVHTLSVGGRYLYDVYFADLGGGFGLTESSSVFFARLEIGMLF
jgi:hypothetical protein